MRATALRVAAKAADLGQLPLSLEPVELPAPGPGEVVVEVKAAGVNPSDVKATFGLMPYAVFPRTPGRDFAGVVVEGPGVGRRVFGSSGDLGIRRDGTHATHLLVEAEALAPVPEGMGFREAAGLGVPFVTAMTGLEKAGMPKAGDWVLVMGVNGKVGQAAAQIASRAGARVIGAVRRAEPYAGWASTPVETVRGDAEGIAAQVRALTGGHGADIVFNTVGDPYFGAAAKSLALDGRQILIAAVDRIVQFDIFAFYRGRHSYVGIDTLSLDSVRSGAVLRALAPGFADGSLRPYPIVASSCFPLAQAREAYAAVLGSSRDRVILQPGNVQHKEETMLAPTTATKHTPFYKSLYAQVLIGIVLAILLGNFDPSLAVQMQPFGDGFIKLIRMMIAFVVFCTVVSGVSHMGDMRKVGRVGGKALLYFEVVSTMALLIGVVVGNVLQPGGGFNADPAKLDAKAIAGYAGQTQALSIPAFLLAIIPNTFIDAFARGDILPVVLLSLLVGYALTVLGERAQPVRVMIDSVTAVVFTVVNVIMRLAPLGAFGAMAFTVGRYGISSLGPLLKLVGVFYLTSVIFVTVVLGLIGLACGFNVFKLLNYIKAEILLTLGTSSSDPALPALMEKLERAGCSRPVVGLVVPTGYVFNTDGTSIYMTLAALFVAQATNTPLSWTDQAALFGVAILTSKGASGITGAGFIALVATLGVVPTIPLAGMALILGIDRFMSEARALVNMIGNAVATIVMAAIEGELDRTKLRLALNGDVSDPADLPADAVAQGD